MFFFIFLEYEKKKQEEMEKSSYDEEFPHRRRNQILAALFATTAMAGYALSSGMFEVLKCLKLCI